MSSLQKCHMQILSQGPHPAQILAYFSIDLCSCILIVSQAFLTPWL